MFLFPVGDPEGVRYRSRPYATIAIIVLCVAAYIAEMMASYPEGYIYIVQALGMSPKEVRTPEHLGALTAITSMFLHGRDTIPMHLLGNMLYLWTFGRRVEDACGPFRFTLFYLMAGFCAGLLHLLLTEPDATIPLIGASGAVSGVMGAYLVLFPGARIRTIFWVVVPVPYPIRIRAVWFLVPWLMLQVLPSLDVVGGTGQYGIAFLAHIGGFLGALFIFLYLRKDALYRYITGVDL